MAVTGDSYSDLYGDLYTGIEIPTQTSPMPQPRKKVGLPEITWLVDDKEVPAEDWNATTSVNGGYDTATLTVPETFERRFPSSFEIDAPVKMFERDGQLRWEGDITNAPTPQDGRIEVIASGGFREAEQRDEDLLYQDRDLSGWQDENGSPHNGTGASAISVSSSEGMLALEVAEGATVAQNDEHALTRWVSGSLIKRFRATVVQSGTNVGYTLILYKATGPTGTRTVVDSTLLSSLGALIDETITSPTDMFLVALKRTGVSHTQPTLLRIELRDVRINDLTSADSFDLSNIVVDIGRRLNWDTSGLSVGVPIGNIGSGSQRIQEIPIWDVNWDTWPFGDPIIVGFQKIITTTAKVNASPLNFLPFYWKENWADALHYLTEVLDWRWRVLGNFNGRGRVLDAGPWGPNWDLSEGSAQVSLKRIPPHNAITVRWTTLSGTPQTTVIRATPDPYELKPNTTKMPSPVVLTDPQPSDSIPRAVGNAQIGRLSAVKAAGTIDITGLSQVPFSPYGVVAGDVVSATWWGPGAQGMRVMQTQMSVNGVTLGVEKPVSVVSLLAFIEQRRAREPYGILRRYSPQGTYTYLPS